MVPWDMLKIEIIKSILMKNLLTLLANEKKN